MRLGSFFLLSIACIFLWNTPTALAEEMELIGSEDKLTSISTISETATSTSDEVTLSTEPLLTTSTSTESLAPTTPSSTESSASSTLPTIPVHVRIEGPDATIFAEDISLPESCSVFHTNTTTPATYTGYKAICALETLQSDRRISYGTTNGSFGVFLDSIDDITNAPDWSASWILRHNHATAMVGIADLTIATDDTLLLTYGPWAMEPLFLVQSSSSSLTVGDTATVTILYYEDDTNTLTPFLSTTTIWTNATSSLVVGGSFTLIADTTTTLFAEVVGMTRSSVLTLTTVPTVPITPPASTPATGGTLSPSPISELEISAVADRVIAFIRSQQTATGEIVDGATTDWLMMTFGARGLYGADIKNPTTSTLDFIGQYNVSPANELNACAGYPRHALALLSAGVPSSNTLVQMALEPLQSPACYTNHIYGQNGTNDDVFALLALLAADTAIDAPIVTDIITTLLSDQNSTGAFTWPGGFASPDITGASINALWYAKQKGAAISDEVFTKAKDYLRREQLADGGWGFGSSDVLTTSWAVMGINALGEGQQQWWNTAQKNPWHVLVSQVAADGSVPSPWAPGTVDWFGTKHIVPALLGRSWPIILHPRIEMPVTEPISAAAGTAATTTLPATQTTSTPISTTESPTSTPTTTSTIQQEENGVGGPPPEEAYEEIVEAHTVSTTKTISRPERPIASPIQPTESNEEPPTIDATSGEVSQSTSVSTEADGSILSTPAKNSTPLKKTAKGVFGGSVALASTLGLYLGWRFVQSLV